MTKLPRRHRQDRRPLRLVPLAALPLLITGTACFADPPPATSSPASNAASPGVAAEALRYRVTVDAPEPLRSTLAASVDLIRWQGYEDMTGGLFDALVRRAIDQAKEAAETEGYFSANVNVDVDRAARPVAVVVRVTPGTQSRVATVKLAIGGAAATDTAGAAAVATVTREWPMPAGTAFRQSAWERAKQQAVETLAGTSFAGAKLAASQASVDPAANTVDLEVAIDSGPPFHVGDLDITGLSRYPADLVRNYRSQRRGERYAIAELDQFVRRLNGTGYFASVQAAIDTDPARAADAPVHVAVIEAPPKKVEVGLGYSTDTAFRANLSYRDVDVGARALQMYVDARVEQKLQNASLRFVMPPGANGWAPSTFARIERTDISGLVTQTGAAGVRMSSLDERNQWQYGAAFYTDRQQPEGLPADSSHALYIDVERAWRRVDDLAAPTKGFAALVQLGAGIPGVSTRGFERVIARYALWQPLGAWWSLTARAEGGAVIAGGRSDIPAELLFRTGGDTTVRGYAFESLGVKEGDAILPARYYTVASVEITRWITQSWGIAAFVDAGNAFDNAADFRIAVGYGVGARVKTPIGPFRLDVAYGEQSRQVRLHFSVGVAF